MKYSYRLMWANSQCLLSHFLLRCLWIMVVLWWFPIRLSLSTEWISGGDTAAFKRRIVNISKTVCLDARDIVFNEEKTMQGSRICVVMFIPWSHAGLTCVECCKDIRVLLYSDGQRKHTAGTLVSFRALRRLLVGNVIHHTYRVGNIIQQFILPASRTYVR